MEGRAGTDTPPGDGGSPDVLSVFVTDRSEAERITSAVGGVTLLAERVPIIPPPA